MSEIICKQLHKRYLAGEVAISNMDIVIKSGEKIAVVGEQFSGKTTLLKIIAGLTDASYGSVTIDGVEVSTANQSKDVIMLFEDYGLFPRKSVRYNLEYSLKLRKVPTAEINRRVERASSIVELTALLDRPISGINELEKVCVSLSRLLLRDAKVVLIDDIFNKLPTSDRAKYFQLLTRIMGEIQATIIYATDNPSEAMYFADRIVCISYSNVKQIGTPIEIYNNPNNMTVANTFISSSAYIKGKLTRECDQYSLLVGEYYISLSSPTKMWQSYIDKEVCLLVDNDNIVISDNGLEAMVVSSGITNNKRAYLLNASYLEGNLYYIDSLDSDNQLYDNIHINIVEASKVFDSRTEQRI